MLVATENVCVYPGTRFWRYSEIRTLVLPKSVTHLGQFHSVHSRLVEVDPLKVKCVNWLHFVTQVWPAFLIADIRALWRSELSARVPECQQLKCRLDLDGIEQIYCNYLMPVYFGGLIDWDVQLMWHRARLASASASKRDDRINT